MWRQGDHKIRDSEDGVTEYIGLPEPVKKARKK